ncbi:MAG TPA: hypothetical protein VD971_09520 [Phycisphaerales bacterium]|nr:hypothetical protein [Phycisphaerales bacterium]
MSRARLEPFGARNNAVTIMLKNRSTAFWTVFFVLSSFAFGVPTCVYVSQRRLDRIHAAGIWANEATILVIRISNRLCKNVEASPSVSAAIAAELSQSPEYKAGEGPGCMLFAPDAQTWETTGIVCVSAEPHVVRGHAVPMHVGMHSTSEVNFLRPDELPDWFGRGIKVSYTKARW